MRESTAKVTSKRQITLPAEVAELLGVEPGDRLLFTADSGQVRVEKARSWTERTAGALKDYATAPPPPPREERRLFEEAVADDVIERMNRK